MMRTQAEKKKSSYREPLILIAFVIVGAILGLTLGEKASVLYPIGQIWLNLLFVLLVPLIFFSISSSIANIADTKRVGKLLVLTIGIFVVTAAIAGGALGNLIDRTTRGVVIDFFDFRIWPIFNVADIAICVGVGLIIWSILKTELLSSND